MNDYRCTYGHSIEYRDREFYFRGGLFVTALLLSDEKPTPLLARSSSLPLSGERAAQFDRGAR